MARAIRLQCEGAIYHVTVRGNDRRDIFLDEGDWQYLLQRLAESVELCEVRLYLFCVLSKLEHKLESMRVV